MTEHVGAAPYVRDMGRLFARYLRNEKALVLALREMYVEGVSTRRIEEKPTCRTGRPSS